MTAENGNLEAVREWLTSEVKLQRYFDKLESHGFKTLETCSVIDENALDQLGINVPYHRKRLLMFSKSLREKLGTSLPNDTEDSVNMEERNHADDPETGNEQPSNLISFVDEEESNSFPLYVNVNDETPGLNDQIPVLPPKKSAKPPAPPIPRRADLEPEDNKPSGGVDPPRSGLPGFPDLPKKAPPIKPPRKTPNRKLSQEKELEDLTNTDLQGGSSAHSSSDAGSGSSEGLASQPPAGDEKEDAIYVNAESALPDLPKRQSSEDIVKLSSTEEPDHKEQSLYGNVESEDSQHVVLPIEPTRTAPKPSSSVKRPIPKPRSRGKSEDGLEVTGLARKAPPVPSNRRPTSVSMSTKKQMVLPNGKPSTLPRYPQSEKRPPPTPPTRQSVTNAAPPTRPSVTNSDRGAGEAGFPSLPLPPFPAPNNDQTESAGEEQYETVGMPQQAAGEMYSFVGTHEHESKRSSVESVAEEAIYEPVESKQEEQSEDDYDSDDCLGDDDMWMVEPGKARGDSVDSTGSMSDIRASKVALSPRVRKSEGYLYKQGGLQGNKGWRKRWFVFDGKALTYYKDKDSLSESLHIIPVGQIKDIDNVKDTKRASFKVITPNRIFILASENTTEMNLWSQTLMEAILVYKGDKDSWKKGGEMCDPDKEGWLKKQGHNVVADWKKRYLAVKEDKICYYDTYEDFQYATPINCINAAIAKVKTADGHRNRFLIITPNKSYSFQAESETEASLWIVAIETAIQKGLGDVEILDKVCENPSNRFCADCGSKDPVWASVNFCVCVCANCIGVHRNLGVHCSKPRSLLMDEKVWNPTLLELMLKIGNANANMLLEHKLPDDDKISHDADSSARREFIYSKYWEKKYCKYHQSFGDPDVLGKVLQDTVVTDDFMATLELILNKVDVRYVPPDSEDERTPLELAQEAGQTLQAELLRQNGGEGGKLDRQISYEDLTSAVGNETLPTSPAEVVYEKEGFLYKKEGGWRKRWFQLKERDLKYTRGPHEKEELGTINLKTVTSLVKCPKGEPLLLDIVTVDKTHSLKADTDEELEAWYSALRSKQVFGVLLSQQELGSDGIPHLVAKCLQFVESYGGLEMEGVYRVNGGQLTMKKLITSFDQDASIVLLTLDECGVHDVTGVLKQYLRRLPDPVIPGDMYSAFIKAGMISDHSIKLQTIKELVSSLPKVNHDTLKEIVFHLTKVVALASVNKMGVPNIAMIFGPTLMSNEQTGRMDDASINLEFSMIGDMINYFQWLFDVKEEEVRKDQIMQDALQKIMRLQSETTQPTTATSEEFTLDIYVNQRHEDPCRVKVSADMTARMVCKKIVAQRSLPPDVNWALFEVIGHGAMERAFQVREKVMAAANWGSGNFLIVKENFIAEQIAPYVGTSLSIEGNLHIRDPRNKNWKQSSVCLKNGYMLVGKGKSFFKAIKSDKSETDQWPLHKLTLYLGVPAEKSTKGLDTSFGFTVVVKTDQEDITRYMCAKDKGDMHRWIASILNMKHPEGIWSDPSQTETPPVAPSAEPKGNLAEDMPIYLGRQSFSLRRKGSSKHIMEELRVKQKSLKRPVDRPFGRDPKGPS